MFALIAGGQVAQLAAMQFPVASAFVWVDVSTVTPSPRIGWTANETAGIWSFSAPSVPVQTATQQAMALLGGGLTITSPALALAAVPFYAMTDASGESVWSLILSEMAALNLSGNTAFADGNATVQWPDMTGALHGFTPAQFTQFAKTLGAFVAQCRNFANGVPGAIVPAATVNIA